LEKVFHFAKGKMAVQLIVA